MQTSRINLDDFAEYKNLFEFIHADINTMDDKELLKLCRKSNRIFHFAGSVGVEHIDKNPSQTLQNNVNLATKLMPIFEQAKKHVIFASTSEIYGDGPFNEEDNASIGASSKMRWGYATAKLLTEFMIRGGNYPYNIVRFFNVVGPGQLGDYGMVMPRFIEKARANEPIIVHGTGQQIRSFCHINDALDALLKVCEHPNELFNIGNAEPTTIANLAVKVRDLAGSTSEIQFVPYDTVFSKEHGDINIRVPDTTKLETLTGYSPKYNLEAIIKDLL